MSRKEDGHGRQPDEGGTGSAGTASVASGIGRFFLKFLAASIVLYVLYIFAGSIYMKLVAYGAKPLLALAGRRLLMDHAMQVTEEISLNPAVFLSLLVAVPGMTWKERIRPALLGVAILTAANILTVFLVFMSYYLRNETLWTGTEFFNLTINFFLPILLWFVLAPVRNLLPGLSRRA